MTNNLINESLDESTSFSSNTHTIAKVVYDNNIEQKIYNIEDTYDSNVLVLLPINKKRVYFYWEFSQEFLDKNIVKIEDITFHILDQKHNLVDTIKCSYIYGEYFYNLKGDIETLSSLKIAAIYKQETLYKNILESNSIKLFSTNINYPESSDMVYMKRSKEFYEVLKNTLDHFTFDISSSQYKLQTKKLQEYVDISKQNVSSNTNLKDK